MSTSAASAEVASTAAHATAKVFTTASEATVLEVSTAAFEMPEVITIPKRSAEEEAAPVRVIVRIVSSVRIVVTRVWVVRVRIIVRVTYDYRRTATTNTYSDRRR